MKVIFINGSLTGVRMMLLTALLLLASFSLVNAQESDFAEVVSKLSAKLELDGDQRGKLASSIETYVKRLDAMFAEQ